MLKIFLIVFLIFTSPALLTANSVMDEKTKERFSKIILEEAPKGLCKPDLLYMECYGVTSSECKVYMDLFFKSCIASIKRKVTASSTLEEVAEYGNQVGQCAGTIYDVILRKAGKANDDCLKKWNEKIIKQKAQSRLYEDKPSAKSDVLKAVKKLYGDKFDTLSKVQQKYILDNSDIMKKITEQILIRQSRMSDLKGISVDSSNKVEFYLHPNGKISGFKYLRKSGYLILDKITLKTIELAYSKYPRPKEKTLIIYDMSFNLAKD